jgi:hypothetical protein
MSNCEQDVPYSVTELEHALNQPMDPYHRDLLTWADAELIRLKALVRNLAKHMNSCPLCGDVHPERHTDTDCDLARELEQP